jgi:hypothetical protein
MENIDAVKFTTALLVATVALFGKLAYVLLTRNGEKMKIRATSVELIDKIINEREWKKQENRIVIEETFEQLYSYPLTFHEIKVLLYADTPDAAFRAFVVFQPLLEMNDKKTKFQYKKWLKPYWLIGKMSLKIPNMLLYGAFMYLLLAFPAAYLMEFLLSDEVVAIPFFFKIVAWFVDIFIWFFAIVSLLAGMKYNNCDSRIKRKLGAKFIDRK